MHRGDGSVASLSEILSAFPDNDFVWTIVEFFGTGRAPAGMSMPDFEDEVRSTPAGVGMTWPEFRRFSADLDQTFDCDVMAFRAPGGVVGQSEMDAAVAKISAFDSSEWEIAVDESVAELQAVPMRIQQIAGSGFPRHR
jgi:hypothetical protein